MKRSPHGKLATPCENCHTNSSWSPLRKFLEFNHNTTAYPLRGRHESVGCRQCHTKLIFSNTSKRCTDCHADMHRRQFGAGCERCHTVMGWQEVRTQQQHQNRFPLLGAHTVQECDACHKGAATGQYAGLSIDCISCHSTDYSGTTLPNHKASTFPTTCQTCHSMDGWPGAKFDHAAMTGFALSGAHAKLDCSACHAGGNFQNTKADCYSCHAKDFAATNSPSHVNAGFPQQCSQCHTTDTWSGAKFDHTALTKFPLTGLHVSQACTACHASGVYAGLSTACASCHLNDYNNTQNPNHRTAGLPQTCDSCHTTMGWNQATMDHSLTKFPLTGAHVSVACAQCHVNGQYTGTSTACASCHINDYNGTTNPNHKAAGYPTDCSLCHTTASFAGATASHTLFPLTGAHTTLQCSQCHSDGVYAGKSTACASCHIALYNAQTNPNHKAAGFSTDCSLCHTTISFTGGKYTHISFQLTGAHTTLQCSQCHSTGVYAGTSTACASCHIALYNAQTNPNHKAAGFSTDCSLCHTTTAFTGGKYTHISFQLSGAHTTLQCSQCHSTGVYAGTSTACASCHSADYNAHNESEPQGCRIPDGLLAVSHDNQFCRRDVCAHRVAAYRHAHASPVLAVPCHRYLCGHVDSLRFVPHRRLQRHNESQPQGCRIPNGLLRLPLDRGLAGSEVRSLDDAVPADGYARVAGLHRLSLQWRIRRTEHGLRFLPPGELQRDHESQSQDGRVPANLRHLPQHHGVGPLNFQPCQHTLPSHREAHHRGLRQLPHQQRLCGHAHGLLCVPQDRLRFRQ